MKAVVAPTTAGESPAAVTAQGALGVNIPAAGLATPTATPIATPTPVQTRAFEEERTRLCQQLDEKVGIHHTNHLSPYNLLKLLKHGHFNKPFSLHV